MAIKSIKNQKLMELYQQMFKCNKCEDLICMSCNKYNGYEKGPLKGGGDASNNCKIIFIGQNPSYRRFKDTNCAFTGGIGDRFREMLKNAGIVTNIFVTNVVKCSTPNNRKPKEVELKNCIFYIKKEIEIIKPQMLVIMGEFARNALKYEGTGNEFWYQTEDGHYSRKLFMRHPNYYFSYKLDEIKQLENKILQIAEESGYR